MNSRGLAYFFVIAILVVGLSIGAVGYGVQHIRHVKSKSQASSIATPVVSVSDFASCVRAGGFTATDYVGYSSGYSDPQGIYSALTCYNGNKRTDPSFLAKVDLCHKSDPCMNLPQQEIASCASAYQTRLGITVNADSIAPNAYSYPALKDDFGRIQYEGCTSTATQEKLPGFVGYYKLDNSKNWRTIGLYFDLPNCKEVDNKGIPPEIMYTCNQTGFGLRAPK